MVKNISVLEVLGTAPRVIVFSAEGLGVGVGDAVGVGVVVGVEVGVGVALLPPQAVAR